MDHFAIPKGAKHMKVPYNGAGPRYSTGPGGFDGYPARCGWTAEHCKGQDDYGGRTPEQVEAFFQSWLYFGVLIEVLAVAGVAVKTDDFLDHSTHFISTKELPSKLRQWNRASSRASTSRKAKWKAAASNIVAEQSRLLLYHCGSGRESSGRNPPFSDEVAASMIALAHTVGRALDIVQPLPTSQLLRRRIQDAGWCPMGIGRALQDMKIDGHYYMAARSEPIEPTAQSHKECTEVLCLAGLVDEADYVNRHAPECSLKDPKPGDELVAINIDSVVQALDAGGFPVVAWNASANRVDVEEFNAETNKEPVFVAISHVWADGMGNPHSNSLPRCQLERLQRLVNGLAGDIKCNELPVRFWMDTLCVPVADHLKKYRNLSIRRMKDIYKHASAVLVVDALISSVRWADPEYEKSLHIYFSNWNRRLWTFQEGFMAKNLMLQFADKAVQHREHINFWEEHLESIKQGHCVTFPMEATTSVMSEFVILQDFINMGIFGADDFQALPIVISRIQHRTTSKMADQTICTATIMGKDPGYLLRAGKGENGVELKDEALEDCRMEVFLESVGKFAPRFVFNACPRLKRDGFRWGPRTILGVPKDAFIADVEGESGVLIPGQGLSIPLPGLLVGRPMNHRTLVQATFVLPQPAGNAVRLRFEVHHLDPRLLQEIDVDREEQFAVIFSYPLKDIVKTPTNGSGVAILPRERVVLGTVQGVGEQIQVRHQCIADMVVLNPLALSSNHKAASEGHKDADDIPCENLDAKTRWLII
ncbi:hypothetical protein PV04_04406 [Phialophora macrospora]|uniref:Heterokaryon incompatibility domain-containing protein n=1 Tax=Phialophora macrospora TaxID=1851006 RepID=A0A0D2G996_9EURO|nr:hypothetical protein PV04_04406 [Phialophora macrospora]